MSPNTIADIRERMARQETLMAALQQDVAEQNKTINEISSLLKQAQGGARVIAAIWTFSGGIIGSGATWVIMKLLPQVLR